MEHWTSITYLALYLLADSVSLKKVTIQAQSSSLKTAETHIQNLMTTKKNIPLDVNSSRVRPKDEAAYFLGKLVFSVVLKFISEEMKGFSDFRHGASPKY